MTEWKSAARRIMVTGSRMWTDELRIRTVLMEVQKALFFHPVENPLALVQGKAAGADEISRRIGDEIGYIIEDHLPDFERYGSPQAYWVRNREMAESGVLMCLAFPLYASPGTRGTMEICRALDIPTIDCSGDDDDWLREIISWTMTK